LAVHRRVNSMSEAAKVLRFIEEKVGAPYDELAE
jgi:hypothetical protein